MFERIVSIQRMLCQLPAGRHGCENGTNCGGHIVDLAGRVVYAVSRDALNIALNLRKSTL